MILLIHDCTISDYAYPQIKDLRQRKTLPMRHCLTGILLSIALLVSSAVYADDETHYIDAYITASYVELRTGPGRGYPVFYIAERDQAVKLLKQRTSWVKVRTENGKEGWVTQHSIAKTVDRDGLSMGEKLPQFADDGLRRWELGFMGGDFGGTDTYTAYTGYHFTRNLSLELALSENFGNFSSGESATINLLHQPFPQWRYSPFFSLGGGVRNTNPRSTLVETEDRKNDVLVVGAGVRISLSQRFLLRVQYKKHTILTNRDDDIEVEEWTIGLSALF
jgi:hypothetical protein